jgi:hypothetical protein
MIENKYRYISRRLNEKPADYIAGYVFILIFSNLQYNNIEKICYGGLLL